MGKARKTLIRIVKKYPSNVNLISLAKHPSGKITGEE